MSLLTTFTEEKFHPHHIQRFTPDQHLEGLATLIERSFGKELARTQNAMVREMRQMARWGLMLRLAHAIKPFPMGYVWMEKGKVVGNVNLSTESGDVWRLSNVAVLPSFRGRGIAGHLVDRAIEYARRHKARYLVLEVSPDNTIALSLYRHRGFKTFETLHELYLSPASWPLFLHPLKEDVRAVRASDSPQLHRLMLSSLSAEHRQRFPVRACAFRRGFWQKILQYVSAAFKDELIFELVGECGQSIVAYGRLTASLFHGPHDLEIHVRPDQRGQWELELAKGLLWSLRSLPRSKVRARIASHHPEAIEALEALGFESVRVLKQMSLEIH
ncbi:MAG: GNAT family N-acetyltransferase [Chloroflexota bacterium]|nr:GNAT family N-acetyltransferase [Chloroflexota bacterium]